MTGTVIYLMMMLAVAVNLVMDQSRDLNLHDPGMSGGGGRYKPIDNGRKWM